MYKLTPSYFWKRALIAKTPIEVFNYVTIGNMVAYSQAMDLISKYFLLPYKQ